MKDKNKLKILIIPSWYPSEMDPNGVPFIRAQAQALARAGHDVTVVFTQPYSFKTVIKQKRLMSGIRDNVVHGVKEILTYVPKCHIKRIDEITRLSQGKKVLKKWTRDSGIPDIVHVHTYLAGKLGVWYHKKYKIPLVTTEHYTGFARGIVKPWELKRARELYFLSSANIAVSGSFASLLKSKTGGEFEVLPNMVNTDVFNVSASAESNDETFTYLFVGSLHDKKNPLMLLEAFISIYQKDKSVRLILAGEGEMMNSLKKMTVQNNLEDVVSFSGFLNRDEVSSLMQKVDTFVLPSRFETFGIVVIEAMATGLPVIVTKSGGPESFVKEGINGLIIDQSREQLEKAMISIRQIDWDKKSIREYVLDNFSEQAVIQELETRYRRIINSVEVIQASREISVSGGISKVAFQLGLQLTNNGHMVTTFTTEQDDLSSQKNIGRVMQFPVPGWIDKLPAYFRNYVKTRYFAYKVNSVYKYKNLDPKCVTISHRDSFGANVAVGHSCHREAVEIKKKEGRSFWWMNPIHSFYLKEERLIFRKPYPVLAAISTSIANEYHKHYKIPKDKIFTIANGVDIERFNPDNKEAQRKELTDEFGLNDDAFILLFVGNEFKRKGLDFVIEALSLLDKNTHLFVLGGADKTPYINLLNKLNLGSQVHFTGIRSDAPYFFSSADLFILPANYEPFGLVGIEALSSGTPILAPRLGGFLDYLRDGKNGYFIERNGEDIADKVKKLKEDRELLLKLSKTARQTALDFSWEKIGKQYSELIESLIK